MEFCYSRIRLKVPTKKPGRNLIYTDAIHGALHEINRQRFESLFEISYDDAIWEWTIRGANWFNWLNFRMWYYKQKLRWNHSTDIVVTEWVLLNFCHKLARMLDPNAKWRDEGDNFLSELDFDGTFPTLDKWIEQVYKNSHIPAHLVIERARSTTPDCFWKIPVFV